MCNRYRNDLRKIGRFIGGLVGQEFSETRIPLRFGNLPTEVFPDRLGLVLRMEGERWAWETMRWGFPSPKPGGPHVTNLRHPEKPYWRPWLGPEQRCAVVATSFFEYDERTRGAKRMTQVEFARADGEPFCFAGLWRPWTGTRGTKKEPVEGEHKLFTFLTTEANDVVRPVHPKAMPVLLGEDEVNAWLTAPTKEAFELFHRTPDVELTATPEG
jgi:putative SOS response-associated peptidase YedK